MSDIKIQDTPAQGTVDLSTDANTGRTKGGDFNQNQMSFSRGNEVPASSGDVASRNGLNNGAAVRGVAVSVTPVDRRTIEGSTPGDFRAKPGDTANASLNAVSGSNKPPRDPVQQAANGKASIDKPWPTKPSENVGG